MLPAEGAVGEVFSENGGGLVLVPVEVEDRVDVEMGERRVAGGARVP